MLGRRGWCRPRRDQLVWRAPVRGRGGAGRHRRGRQPPPWRSSGRNQAGRRCDRVRPPSARLPSRRVSSRLPVVRLHRRGGPRRRTVQAQRTGLRRDERRHRCHRAVQLGLRRATDPDRESHCGGAAGDGQPVEHLLGAHPWPVRSDALSRWRPELCAGRHPRPGASGRGRTSRETLRGAESGCRRPEGRRRPVRGGADRAVRSGRSSAGDRVDGVRLAGSGELCRSRGVDRRRASGRRLSRRATRGEREDAHRGSEGRARAGPDHHSRLVRLGRRRGGAWSDRRRAAHDRARHPAVCAAARGEEVPP